MYLVTISWLAYAKLLTSILLLVSDTELITYYYQPIDYMEGILSIYVLVATYFVLKV